MNDRIDDELKRSGTISTRIDQAILDAISIYQKKRFRFSEATFTFNTVVSQEFYTSSDNANIANLYLIDYLILQIGTARFDLVRRNPEDIDLLTQSGTQQGQPQVYSYFDEQIRFYPVPSAVYPVICSAHLLIAGPAAGSSGDSTTGIRWFTDAERLIRCRAKYSLAVNNINDPDLARRMSPDPPEPGEISGETWLAYEDLKAETAKLTATGRVRPTQF